MNMPSTTNYANHVAPAYCARCNMGFKEYEDMVCTGEYEFWHMDCFVCCRCFAPFNEKKEYYDYGGRKYCEKDFQTLFAPCCSKCQKYIIGRVIYAMHKSWHAACFCCALCTKALADHGFILNAGRPLCHDCNYKEKEKSSSNNQQYTCSKCQGLIDGPPLMRENRPFHAYHFNCITCGIELRHDSREVKGDLYCLKCHDQLEISVCGSCRRPIEERVVTALGKKWHVEHFVCSHCEKPFLGKKHFENKGLAYCEDHYHELFGVHCYVCNIVVKGNVYMALDKAWCTEHFACSFCNSSMNQKSKFYDVDSKPCCKKCFKKFPNEFKKRIRKQLEEKKKQKTIKD